MSELTLGRKVGEARHARPVLPASGLGAGTTVLTLAGAIPVDYLCPGDRIITRDGARTLRDVHVQVVHEARMICVSASALGVDRPDEDILISPDQPILIRDWRARALKGAERVMVPAEKLIDGEYIFARSVGEQRLYVLEFDAPAVIYAGGLELGCAPASFGA